MSGPGFIFIFLGCIFMAYNENRILDPALTPRFITAFVLLSGGSLLMLSRKNFLVFDLLFRPDPLLLSLGLYLILGIISIFYSSNTAEGIFDLLKMILLFCVVLILGAIYLNNVSFIRRFVFSVSLFSIAAAIPGMIKLTDFAIHGGYDVGATYKVLSLFTNRNIYSEILLFALPFSVYGFFFLDKAEMYLCGLAAAMSFSLIFGLMAREILVAFLAGSLVTAGFWVIMNAKNLGKAFSMIQSRKLLILAVSGFLLPALLISLAKATDHQSMLHQQTSFVAHPYSGSGKARLDLWKKSLHLIQNHPVAGSGLGSWRIVQMQYPVNKMSEEDGVTTYQNPHNDFIWIATELGITGLLCYLFIFGTAFFYLIAILKKLKGKSESFFYYAILFGITAYITISNLGFPRDRVEEQILLGIMFSAILIGYYRFVKPESPVSGKPENKIRNAIAASIMLLIMLSGVVLGSGRFYSEMHLKNAYAARDSGKPKEVIAEIQKAESFLYRVDPFNIPLNWYSGTAYALVGDSANARIQLALACRINPYQVHVLNDYASVQNQFGANQQAIDLYKKALWINPNFNEARFNLCTVYFQAGLLDSAITVLRNTRSTPDNERYKEIMDALVPAAVMYARDHIAEKEIRTYLDSMMDHPGWCRSLYDKAVKERSSIGYQCVLDFFDSMDLWQYSEWRAEAGKLKKKYRDSAI
jgi:O-antigen ligase